MVWKEALQSRNIRLRKTRGQNFLAAPLIAKRIVDLLELQPADVVLEIGPGLGALTGPLMERAKFVCAVEIEKAFCDVLNEWYGLTRRFEVLQADFLDVDLPALVERMRMFRGEGGSLKVVSNLPYYISTAVLTRLIDGTNIFSRMVLTMQKEVAERITAPPGNKRYGSLSVFAQYFCRTKLEFKIPAGAFYPSPKVESAVVCFVPWENPPVLCLDKDLFFRVVRASFSMRRKTLRNSLEKFFRTAGLGSGESKSLLENCSIDGRRRAETLTLSEFARISNLLSQRLGCPAS